MTCIFPLSFSCFKRCSFTSTAKYISSAKYYSQIQESPELYSLCQSEHLSFRSFVFLQLSGFIVKIRNEKVISWSAKCKTLTSTLTLKPEGPQVTISGQSMTIFDHHRCQVTLTETKRSMAAIEDHGPLPTVNIADISISIDVG